MTNSPAFPARSMFQRRGLPYLCVLLTLCVLAAGCGKRPRPLPPVSAPSTPPPARPGADREATLFAPELDVLIEPAVIGPGESALLSWTARNAETVVIEPAIGPVDLSGRIKVFPDDSATWTVTADGPGGNTVRQVRVEVRSPGAPLPDTPAVGEEDLSRLSFEEQFQAFMKPVFFRFDSAELDEQARLTLDSNARWLLRPENLSLRVVIEGHADSRGSEEYNLALGDLRAVAAKEYLVGRGVSPDRLIPLSLGEERPVDPRQTDEAYAQNRRAQFVLPTERP